MRQTGRAQQRDAAGHAAPAAPRALQRTSGAHAPNPPARQPATPEKTQRVLPEGVQCG